MIDSVSSNKNYFNPVSLGSVNNTESVKAQNGVQAQKTGVPYVAKDGISLSSQANQMIDSGNVAPVIDANEENYESHQVGGVGANITGDMTVAQMKTALAEARGISESKVIVVKGSGKDDKINVTAGKNGSIDITINGKKKHYSREQATRLIIDGGKGNDTITVDKKVKNDLVIMGGDGNDTIKGGSGNDTIVGGKGNDKLYGNGGNDRIVDDYGANKIYGGAGNDVLVAHTTKGNTIDGGSGNDYLEGGDGNDTMKGGTGYDVMYGLGGNDTMDGGDGKDYIDGGTGNDKISGGKGNDILIGGKGNDTLKGGAGNDLLVGSAGKDKIYVGSGTDKIITDGNDSIDKGKGKAKTETVKTLTVPDNFTIEGDHFVQERIQSDLDFLANTKQGKKMLKDIASTGHNVTFDVTPDGSSCGSYMGWNSDPNRGSDSFVHYNISKISLNTNEKWANRAPVVSMYHEMCHSYNAAFGTMNQNYYNQNTGKLSNSSDRGAAKGVEWQAVGIANKNVQANHSYITENGLRSLLGFNRRERY